MKTYQVTIHRDYMSPNEHYCVLADKWPDAVTKAGNVLASVQELEPKAYITGSEESMEVFEA